MFKRNIESLKDILLRNLREQGLETPLMQKRLVEAWPEVAGPVVARYTLNTYIYNQTLFVRLSNPALRSDLSMMRGELVKKLNDVVGEQVITDIRFRRLPLLSGHATFLPVFWAGVCGKALFSRNTFSVSLMAGSSSLIYSTHASSLIML